MAPVCPCPEGPFIPQCAFSSERLPVYAVTCLQHIVPRAPAHAGDGTSGDSHACSFNRLSYKRRRNSLSSPAKDFAQSPGVPPARLEARRGARTESLLASPIQDPGGECSDENATTCQTAHHEPHGRRRRVRRVLCQAESARLPVTSSSCGIGTACGPHRRGCLATPSTALAA